MPIAVVLLHYNRWDNLRLALRALQEQTLPRSEFHVVVADDGSTDATVPEMRRLVVDPAWAGHLHLVSGGPHHDTRISRIHNIGIANIPPECSFFVLLASDMCLAPDALEQFASLHWQHPEAVILTRLDWLPPLNHSEIEAVWDAEGFEGVAARVPQRPMDWHGQTLVGAETRDLRATATLEPFRSYPFHPVYGLPTQLYWDVGGYDEGLVGYGWQELELALRIEQRGVQMLSTMEIRSLHIWHPKDLAIAEQVEWQRQKNTANILERYGAQPNPLNYRKWTYWRHYQRVHGGSVVYALSGEAGLYAVNAERSHALRLPHAGWLHALGFAVKDVAFVSADYLHPLSLQGQAEDALGECDFATLVDDLEARLAERLEKQTAAEQHDKLLELVDALETRLKQEFARESPGESPEIQQALAAYDEARMRADRLPGAGLPLAGFVIRTTARILLMGKVWAAERQLLQALVRRGNDKTAG